MTERLVHRLYEMIAVHAGSRILAVTPANFRKLVAATLPHLDGYESASYLLTFTDIGVTSREHMRRLPEWDACLVSKLQQNMAELGPLVSFRFDGAEARRYLPDLLEAFRGNHVGEFSWSVDDQLGSTRDPIVSVQVFDTPGLIDRLTKRERVPRNRQVFPLSAVRAASGTTMRFVVECDGFSLGFASNGSVVRAP